METNNQYVVVDNEKAVKKIAKLLMDLGDLTAKPKRIECIEVRINFKG